MFSFLHFVAVVAVVAVVSFIRSFVRLSFLFLFLFLLLLLFCPSFFPSFCSFPFFYPSFFSSPFLCCSSFVLFRFVFVLFRSLFFFIFLFFFFFRSLGDVFLLRLAGGSAGCAGAQAVEHVPSKVAGDLYIRYAKLEETHGLMRHAASVLDRACAAVEESEMLDMFRLYVAKV